MQKQKQQTFNDGICTIYTVSNLALAGEKPKEGLVAKTEPLRYEERTVGLTRYWTGKQNHVKVDRLIRIAKRPDVSTQDIAITEDGIHHNIVQVQPIAGSMPAVMDLTLEKVVAKYDIG